MLMLREVFDKEKAADIKKKVNESYGPNGTHKINDLHDFYGQNDLIRSTEWCRIAEATSGAKKGKNTGVINGLTWEKLAGPLFERIARLRRLNPNLVPDYAMADHESLCYFVAAIAEFRGKGPQPCVPYGGMPKYL